MLKKLKIGIVGICMCITGSNVWAKIDVGRLEQTAEDQLKVKNLPTDISGQIKVKKAAIVIDEKTKDSYNIADELESQLRSYLKQGGISVVERDKMEDLFKEQKFQMTGAVNTEDMVKIGNVAQVDNILYANISNADASEKFTPAHIVQDKEGNQATVPDNWEYSVKVMFDFRIVSVETGETLVSVSQTKTKSGSSESKGGVSLKGLAEKCINAAVDDSVPEFQKAFPLKGYIVAMKGKRKVALINLGKSHGISEGRKFDVYEISEMQDVTGKVRTQKSKVTTLKVFQVDDDSAWTEPDDKNKILIGQTVEAQPETRSVGHKLMRGMMDFIK